MSCMDNQTHQIILKVCFLSYLDELITKSKFAKSPSVSMNSLITFNKNDDIRIENLLHENLIDQQQPIDNDQYSDTPAKGNVFKKWSITYSILAENVINYSNLSNNRAGCKKRAGWKISWN